MSAGDPLIESFCRIRAEMNPPDSLNSQIQMRFEHNLFGFKRQKRIHYIKMCHWQHAGSENVHLVGCWTGWKRSLASSLFHLYLQPVTWVDVKQLQDKLTWNKLMKHWNWQDSDLQRFVQKIRLGFGFAKFRFCFGTIQNITSLQELQKRIFSKGRLDSWNIPSNRDFPHSNHAVA